MKRARYVWVVFLFTLVGLLAIIPPRSVGAQQMPSLFPEGDIGIIIDLVLERRGDLADVYFPDVSAAKKNAFPIVAVLQGAGVDKSFYSGFGTQLARFGFVVVIPNHFVVFGPQGTPPVLFPDEFVILDVLAQMEIEDHDNRNQSGLLGKVDTTRMGLAGHSAGGAASLFAIGRSCQFPFCGPPAPPSIFPLPDAVRAGAFYGTNTCGLGGELNDPRCIDFAGIPPNFEGMIFGINNENIPVALVQGANDGISTSDEAQATIAVISGPSELIYILNDNNGANHYGITDVNNPPGAVPDPNPQFISQQVSIKKIALASGEFLFDALTDEALTEGEFPVSSKKEKKRKKEKK